MAKRKKVWYYVSYYTEYPIYAPEEGGYYYAGVELMESWRFGKLNKARNFLRKLAADYCMTCTVSGNNAATIGSRIGEGEFIRVETVMGKCEKGFVPYQ